MKYSIEFSGRGDAAGPEAIDDLHVLLEAEGRDSGGVAVQLKGPDLFGMSDDEIRTRVDEFEQIGVTHLVLETQAGPTAMAIEQIEAFDIHCQRT